MPCVFHFTLVHIESYNFEPLISISLKSIGVLECAHMDPLNPGISYDGMTRHSLHFNSDWTMSGKICFYLFAIISWAILFFFPWKDWSTFWQFLVGRSLLVLTFRSLSPLLRLTSFSISFSLLCELLYVSSSSSLCQILISYLCMLLLLLFNLMSYAFLFCKWWDCSLIQSHSSTLFAKS
mgnify:CR=1 FL=1